MLRPTSFLGQRCVIRPNTTELEKQKRYVGLNIRTYLILLNQRLKATQNVWFQNLRRATLQYMLNGIGKDTMRQDFCSKYFIIIFNRLKKGMFKM